MKILHLAIKKKWFDLIAEGKKIKEYREYKPYWISRIKDKKYDRVIFTNGYGKDRPFVITAYWGYGILDTDGSIGENGEQLNGKYFVLNLGRVLAKFSY